jgi:hypothetical protein
MKRRIRTLSEAKTLLQPYYETIMEAMQKSFALQLEVQQILIDKGHFIQYKPRTKANMISDHIETYITDSFSEIPNVTAGVFNDVFGLNVSNEFFIRFKKMDKLFKTGNVNTTQQKEMQKQHQIIGFPDNPTFVFAGYIPDVTWTNVIGYYLACWDGKTLEWFDEFGNSSFEQFAIEFNPSDDEELHKKIEKQIRVSAQKVIPLKAKGNE